MAEMLVGFHMIFIACIIHNKSEILRYGSFQAWFTSNHYLRKSQH